MDEEDDVPAPLPGRHVRADVVGSLLRPARLLRARRDLAEGRLSPARFKRIEDRAVDEAVALQEEAGLPVVTDGEMRRESFQSQLTEAVEGFAPHDLSAFAWGVWMPSFSSTRWAWCRTVWGLSERRSAISRFEPRGLPAGFRSPRRRGVRRSGPRPPRVAPGGPRSRY